MILKLKGGHEIYLNHSYNLDCELGLSMLRDGCIDLIVTSPPYNCRKMYDVVGDQCPWPDYYVWIERVLRECYRVLAPGGVLAVNVPEVVRWQVEHKFRESWSDFDPALKSHSGNVYFLGRGRIEPLGFRLFFLMRGIDSHMREPITWVKGHGGGREVCPRVAMGTDSNPNLRCCKEMILLGSKSRWFHDGGSGRRGRDAVPFMEYTKDVWYIPPVSSKKHPCIFPVEIPRRLISLFVHKPGAVVMDPFMGLGSTARAAVELGVSWLGFDINADYCAVANSYGGVKE